VARSGGLNTRLILNPFASNALSSFSHFVATLLGSIAAVVFFFTSMTFLEGKGIHEATRRVQAAYIPTLVRNWGVFIPTQIVNFAFVPHHLRFVVVGVVSLFWNTYLSYANMQTKRLVSESEKTEVIFDADLEAAEKNML